MITELDIDVLPHATQSTDGRCYARNVGAGASNPYAAGLPDSVQQALARAVRRTSSPSS